MSVRRVVSAFNVTGWLVVLGAVALWQLLVETGVLEFDYVPAPTGVADGFSQLVDAGELWPTVSHTLGVTLLTTGMALVIGVALGTLVGLLTPIRVMTMSTVDVLRTLPVVALMPVALLVWGPTGRSEIIVATWAAVWPLLVNTAAGVSQVHTRLHDVASTFQLAGLTKFFKIVMPAAMPQILVGARLAVINALVVAIVAEMLINPDGLGWALVQAMQGLQPEQMWAWVVVTGVIGYALNALLIQAVRIGMRGGASGQAAGAGA